MSIAAILLTIAVPSFRYVTNSNRIAGEVNGLLGDLQFARAEAVKEGRYVTVCISTDGQSCVANATTWQSGWIVFSDPTDLGVNGVGETPLRVVQKTFSSSDTFVASQNVCGRHLQPGGIRDRRRQRHLARVARFDEYPCLDALPVDQSERRDRHDRALRRRDQQWRATCS